MAFTTLFLVFLFSIAIENVTVLMSLFGASSQIYLTFVIPVLLYIKAFRLSKMRSFIYLTIAFILTSIGITYIFKFILDEFLMIIF